MENSNMQNSKQVLASLEELRSLCEPIKKKSDCDILLDNAKESANRLERCFETIVDERKSKWNVIGSLFGFGFSLTKLTVNAGVCAIKHSPKAIVAVAAAKRELIAAIEEEIHENRLEMKREALEEKIAQLQYKALR